MSVIRAFVSTHRLIGGLLAIACCAVLVGGAGLAVAAIPSTADGSITACVNKTSRAVRIIDFQAGKRCTSNESKVAWSKGYRYRGAWSAVTAYGVLDVVTSGGSSYLAKAASTNKAPDSHPTVWGLLAAAGAPGEPGPGAVAAVAYTTVITPDYEDRAIPGTGLTLRAICGASNTAAIYLMDQDASASYDVYGSYDLTATGSSHANLVYTGATPGPNLPTGLGPIHYTQNLGLGVSSEVVLSWSAGTGGMMTVDVAVLRGSSRTLVHASLFLSAGECLVQADATPAS